MTYEDILREDFERIPDHKWFVARVPYGRENAVAAEIATGSRIPYVPKVKISNLLFIYTTESDIKQMKESMITFPDHPRWKPSHVYPMFDHTRHNAYGLDLLMTVPFEEMRSFIRLTMVEDPHVEIVPEPEAVQLQKNELVDVVDGRFKGVRGRLARLHHQTCVVVMLDGVCTVSSAYIPRQFIRPAQKEAPQGDTSLG